MHCIQKYATACNASLNKPHLEESFFPIPFEKYMTIDLGAEFNNRSYSFFKEVISELSPILQENNIRIIQIGDPKDQPLEGVYYLNAQLNLNHTVYVLNKSVLHLSSQSFSSNVADILDIPQVLLYEENEKDICAPYWNRDLIKFILYKNSDRPSFGAPTKQNNINKIKPEKIAIEVVKKLKINTSKITTNTLHLGHLYNLRGLEVIPNFTPPNNLYANSVVNVRADLAFSIPAIQGWCDSGRKLAIRLPKIVDVNFLKYIKNHIQGLGYEVTMDCDPKILKDLQTVGVPLKYITYETDAEKLQELRLKFLNFVIEQEIKSTKKDLDLPADIDYTKLNFKSSKKILHNNQMFESLAHALSGSQNNNIIDSSVFWEDLKFYKIYSNNG